MSANGEHCVLPHSLIRGESLDAILLAGADSLSSSRLTARTFRIWMERERTSRRSCGRLLPKHRDAGGLAFVFITVASALLVRQPPQMSKFLRIGNQVKSLDAILLRANHHG